MTAAHRGGGPLPHPPDLGHRQGCQILIAPSWARAFPGTARQASAARRFVASLLERSPFCDDAVVVVSELFSNALQHTKSGKPGGLVIVQVSRWLLGVRVAVTDQGSAKRPVIRDASPCRELAENGTGLYLASRLAECLEWHDDISGRTICAILGARPPQRHCQMPSAQASEPSRLAQLALPGDGQLIVAAGWLMLPPARPGNG